MWSPTSNSVQFYSQATHQPLRNGPGERREAWLAIPEALGDWTKLQAWIQDREVPVSRVVADGAPRTVVPWPRSGAGRHRAEARGDDGPWHASIEIHSETIDRAAFIELLEDLARRLPASIALSLHCCGARLPIEPTALDVPSLPEELERLQHTVLGWPDGVVGLAAILESIRAAPVVRLAVEPELRPVARSLRPDLSRLGPMLATLPLDQRGRPRQVVDLSPSGTYDTPENRFIAHFTGLVTRRLRRIRGLSNLPKQVDQDALRALEGRLAHAMKGLPEFNALRPLTAPPASQAMLRLAPYRRGLRLWKRFRRSLAATLEDRRLDTPSRSLPELYELWGTLSAIAGTAEAIRESGCIIEHQELMGETPFGFGVRALPSGRSAIVARLAASNLQLELVPQARASANGPVLWSRSHEMIPDIAVLIRDGSELKSVLVLDPKYKRKGNTPLTKDFDKMHTYRDAIRSRHGHRIVNYAGIIYPGPSIDYNGEIGAISGIPGRTSIVDEIRAKVLTRIDAESKLHR